MKAPESYRGTDISYVSICLRRAWLSLHEIYITDGTDFVKLGAYANEIQRKFGYSQVSIGRNKLDYVQFLPNGKLIVHEFKRGRKTIEADALQLTHYMLIASIKGFSIDHGEIHLLGARKIRKLDYPNEFVERVKIKYQEIDSLMTSGIPIGKRNYFCSHGCSYVEFCWG
ncbi:CRISPR-associated protein Cas4 [Thermoplasmatales archaeon]|nr:CRISPR-associated protein Cas4 [Thermoplasmatales archaeon]